MLQQIFLYLPVTDALTREDFPTRLIPLHVCRYWRSATLSHAKLWDPIPLNNTVLTTLALDLLKRWQGKPWGLAVHASPGIFVHRDAIDLVLNEPLLLKRLTCSASPRVAGILRQTTTDLTSLNLWEDTSQGAGTLQSDDGEENASHIPQEVRTLQRLEELRIHSHRRYVTSANGLLGGTSMLTVLELTLPTRM